MGATTDIATGVGAHADPVEVARRQLISPGAVLMPPSDVNRCIGADKHAWAAFSTHWDNLAPDSYAKELGTRRLRRYGRFSYRAADGATTLLAHREFVQPEDSNPLYINTDRHFAP